MKIYTNDNGVTVYIDGDSVHASYYVGEGVTWEKTFTRLTKKQISSLSLDDVKP